MARKTHVSFEDANGRTWTFDLAFMQSHYTCQFGQGCGDETGVGECCVHGATLWYDEDDVEQCRADEKLVRRRIKELTKDDWQLRKVGRADGGPLEVVRGAPMTRTHDGGCVFNNRAGFKGGAGCAFHLAALRRGESPLDWKPRVCWAVPIMREEQEDGSYVIRAVRNLDWSLDGEDEPLDWWCIDDEASYNGPQPVYRSLREELIRICGQEVYDQLAAHLDKKRRRTKGPALPMA